MVIFVYTIEAKIANNNKFHDLQQDNASYNKIEYNFTLSG